jgi:hypothetical protein
MISGYRPAAVLVVKNYQHNRLQYPNIVPVSINLFIHLTLFNKQYQHFSVNSLPAPCDKREKSYVDNPLMAGEKKCRKKKYFKIVFESYFNFTFAVRLKGNIPITKK